MSDNLPALPQLRTSQELVNPVTDSWAEMLPQVAELARAICTTQFVPEALRNNVAGTTAAILYNREIGLPPMTGLNAVHVIKGKVGISAEMMRAQVLAAGHQIWFEETNTSYCVISGQRAGSDRVTTVKYSETDAKTAGLFSNDNYKKNPRRMYQARATSELCALIFPDVIRGMVSSEELEAEAEAGHSIPVPAEGGTTVQRKARPRKASPAALEAAAEVPLPGETKTDDGAGSRAETAVAAGAAGSNPAGNTASSSPFPPLPGEAGYDETSAAATAEPDAEAAGTQSPAGANPPDDAASASTPEEVPVAPPLPGEEDLPEPVEDMTDPQRGKLFALMSEHGLTDKPAQLEWISQNLGRVLTSRSQLTKADAKILIDLLESGIEAETTPRPISRGDLRLLGGLLRELGVEDTAERMHIASTLIGRTPEKDGKPSSEGLTAAEGKTLMEMLGRCKNRDQVEALIELAESQRAEAGDA